MFSTDEAEVAASADDVELGEEGIRLEMIWDNLARLIVPGARCSSFLRTYQHEIRIEHCPGAGIGEAWQPASADDS